MATSQDFDDLIVRITTATNTLETATNVIDAGTADIQQAVTDAEAAATTAQQAATDAGVDAQAAQDAYNAADQLVTDLEAAVVLDEAPQDGQVYGRQDAAWVLTSAGGSGTVTSVNTVEPDGTGDVTLAPSNIGALPDTYTPAWLDITGKPTFATVATSGAYSDLTGTPTIPTATSDLTNDSNFISEAPVTGTQYVRIDAGWSELTIDPTAVPFPADSNTIWDGSAFVSDWVDANPHKTYSVGEIGYYSNGQFISGEDVFYSTSPAADTSLITPGKYHFTTTTFTQGPLQNKEGYIEVSDSETAEKYVTAFVNPQTGETEGEVYLYNNYDDEFIAVGASGGGSAGGFAFDEPNVTYDGSNITAWPHSNPNKAINIALLSVDVGGTTTVSAENIFLDSEAVNELPEGKYYSSDHTGNWSSNPFGGTYFPTLEVVSRLSRKQCFAYIFTGGGGTDNSIWMLEDGFASNTWVKVAASSVT